MDITKVTEGDVTKLPLSEEQIELMKILRVRLYQNHRTGEMYISNGYWSSIKPVLQEALIRVLDSHE